MKTRSNSFLQAILMGAGSIVWSMLSAGVRTLSSSGLLKRQKLSSRVISVGNIQAGGAGKTPLVALIANEAAALGLKVCILIRGFKGEWEARGGVITPRSSAGSGWRGASSPQSRSLSPSRRAHSRKCGDEAALLEELCPAAYIGVGADRYRQYLRILKQAQTEIDLVILDDGFQNWRIHKDLEILALTSAKPWEVLFRDQVSTTRKADLLVWTKGQVEPKTYGLPRVRIRFEVPVVQGVPIWLVTGVADQESVYQTALDAGYRIVKRVPFEDHVRYTYARVRELLLQARLDHCRIAITAKDWVKWRDLGVLETEVQILELNLVFEEGRDLWSQKLWGQLAF